MSVAFAHRAVMVDETRWTPTRKLEVLNQFDQGDAAERAALLVEHGLSDDEISQWRGAYSRHGLAGLAVGKQDRR